MINLLESEKRIFNVGEFHRIREQRNKLAHNEKNKLGWQDVEDDLAIIHNELQNLGLVDSRPNFTVFGERNPVKSDDPNVIIANKYACGVREEDIRVFVMTWTMNFYNRRGTPKNCRAN
ncbi:MAG: hypothetical protein JW849_02220 [Phycisphaerae bacterium]|nr:hypothetical protein [Phycisphaerae bacterium]